MSITYYRTDELLDNAKEGACLVTFMPGNAQERAWVTPYYLPLGDLLAGDILAVAGRAQVRSEVDYNAQSTCDVLLVGKWAASDIDVAGYNIVPASGYDIQKGTDHYWIHSPVAFFQLPDDLPKAELQFRIAAASDAADGNGYGTVLPGYGFLSCLVFRSIR